MENLLRNNYTVHYELDNCTTGDISVSSSLSYFELKDDDLIIYQERNTGVAKFNNLDNKNVTIINYEKFVNLLPHNFKQGRSVCDLILISENNEHFLLNELTDTLIEYVNPFTNSKGEQFGKRAKAKEQLLQTLEDLLKVPNICTEIEKYKNKRCCFFNKQSMSPSSITATSAFGRINTITSEGFKLSNTAIESRGFEYYEYSGNQVLNI